MRLNSANARSITVRTISVSVTSRIATQSRSPYCVRRPSRLSLRRTVAATWSPRDSNFSVSMRPNPEDAPVKPCLDHDVVLGRPWIFVQRLLEGVQETLLPRPPDVLHEGARIGEPCIALRTHGVMPIDVRTWSIGLHDEHRDRLVDHTLLRSAGKLGQHIVKQVGALVRDDRLSEAVSIIHDDDA